VLLLIFKKVRVPWRFCGAAHEDIVNYAQNLELHGNLVPAKNTQTQNETPEIKTIKPHEKKLPPTSL
jgi:hypothetical protein